jgi:addiction module RelE/StbE family toxin
MRTVLWDDSFRRALKRLVRKNPRIQSKVTAVLLTLEADPFTPSLKAHKLQGELKDLWACLVDYDCRIVFAFEPIQDADQDAIVLIDIGSHDEVY